MTKEDDDDKKLSVSIPSTLKNEMEKVKHPEENWNTFVFAAIRDKIFARKKEQHELKKLDED